MVYFGSYGSNNIYLGGNTNANVQPSSDFGVFGVKFRACSCMCLFCCNSYSLNNASTPLSTPKYDNDWALGVSSSLALFQDNDRSFGVNLSKGLTGTSGVRFTTPIASSYSSTQYLYNCVGMSNNQNYVGVQASISSGYAFAGWRINSTSGTVATTVNATNFYYNSTYGGTSFLNINWLYSSANTSQTIPSVTTTSATYDSTNTEIDMVGNVTSDGGATITTRGFVGSTNTSPTTSNNIFNVTVSGTTGVYSASQDTSVLLVGPSGTTYYVRAYATNSLGTAYGSSVSVFVPSQGWSDRRLKTNINYKRTSPSGLKVYHFNYIEPELYGEGVFEGVMADEIPQEHVVTAANGYKRVLYSGIDVDFKKVSN